MLTRVDTYTIEQSSAVDRHPAGVLVVDDSRPFLALLRDVVRATRQLEPVGEAQSGEQAVEMTRKLHPDMVLIDVRMPGLGGIQAVNQIKASHPTTLVALISTTHPDDLPAEADDSADAVIWKSELTPNLLDEIWRRYHDPGRPPNC